MATGQLESRFQWFSGGRILLDSLRDTHGKFPENQWFHHHVVDEINPRFSFQFLHQTMIRPVLQLPLQPGSDPEAPPPPKIVTSIQPSRYQHWHLLLQKEELKNKAGQRRNPVHISFHGREAQIKWTFTSMVRNFMHRPDGREQFDTTLQLILHRFQPL